MCVGVPYTFITAWSTWAETWCRVRESDRCQRVGHASSFCACQPVGHRSSCGTGSSHCQLFHLLNLYNWTCEDMPGRCKELAVDAHGWPAGLLASLSSELMYTYIYSQSGQTITNYLASTKRVMLNVMQCFEPCLWLYWFLCHAVPYKTLSTRANCIQSQSPVDESGFTP